MVTIQADLGPLNWLTRRVYLHEADEPTVLEPGEVVELLGEDGRTYRATVARAEVGELGRRWTLRLT